MRCTFRNLGDSEEYEEEKLYKTPIPETTGCSHHWGVFPFIMDVTVYFSVCLPNWILLHIVVTFHLKFCEHFPMSLKIKNINF